MVEIVIVLPKSEVKEKEACGAFVAHVRPSMHAGEPTLKIRTPTKILALCFPLLSPTLLVRQIGDL
jgi:hypothetical protein